MRNAFLLLSGALLLGILQAPVPQSSISGRVTNAAAAGAVGGASLVTIGSLGYRDGRRVFMPTNSIQADGQGNYNFQGVRPGEYYIRAEGALSPRGISTYYPGAIVIDAATKIAVEAGQEVVGIDFDASNPPTFKVSGTVLNIPAAAGANGLTNSILGITFVTTDRRSPDSNAGPLAQTARTGANGEFEISLPAGEWDIFPVIPLRSAAGTRPGAALPATYATGRTRVRLTDVNVDNVVINVGSADVKGRILVSGASSESPDPFAAMRITLVPWDNYPSPLLSHVRTPQFVGPSGEFTFSAVPPGRYVFQIPTIPSDLYLSDMRVGPKSIYDDGVVTVGTEPLDPVEIVLSRGGGKVRVTVTGSDAAGGVGGSLRRIVLMPTGARRENGLLYKTVAVDPLTTLSSVAPGRYKVFAFQELPPGGAEQDTDFMAKYESIGVTIDVAAGETTDVHVPWISSGK